MAIRNINVYGFHKIEDLDIEKMRSVFADDLFDKIFSEAHRIESTCDNKTGQIGELYLAAQLEPFSKRITVNDKNLDFGCNEVICLHKMAEHRLAMGYIDTVDGVKPVMNEDLFKAYSPEEQNIIMSVVRIGNYRYCYYEII